MCSRVEPGRRGRRERRGIVLIFVVAVLVLLAVIATTYLSMARMDRVPTEIKGGLPGGDSPPSLPVPLGEINLDVYGWTSFTATGWAYRPASGVTVYANYLDTDYLDDRNRYGFGTTAGVDESLPATTDFHTRLQHDPWLASRAPELYGAPINAPAWPKISRWIELWTPDDPKTPGDETVWTFSGPGTDRVGQFESPFNPDVLTATSGWVPAPLNFRRTDAAIPSYIRVAYGTYPGTSFKSPSDYNQKVAIYPAFKFPDDPKQYLAADADGDGVADAALFSLNWWAEAAVGAVGTDRPFQDSFIPAGFYAPGDPQHPTRWYAAVRIVDAGGAINVNTAWRRDFDLNVALSTGGQEDKYTPAPPTTAAPNYGFFRSNIGLYELLLGQQKAPDQWGQFTAYRLGRDPKAAPGSLASFGGNTARGDYQFATIGEALEMNLGRRPVTPGGAPVYRSFPASLSSSLAYLNGLTNPRVGRSDLELTLDADVYHNVPNWAAANIVTDAEKETRSFTFFAPPSTVLAPDNTKKPPQDTYSPLLWWNSTYNPDDAVGGTRDTYFSQIGAYAGGSNVPARTRRHLMTTANPQSTSSRIIDPSPTWLLSPSVGVEMEKFPGTNDARPKGSINTDEFGTLWRQFYMAMADPNYGAGTTPSPAGGGDVAATGHAVALAGAQALYLRSAIAAVNAIDMRDTDDDITTKRIEIPADGGSPARSVMVAGCEKQLFVRQVEVVTDDKGIPVFRITVTNPYAAVNGAADYSVITTGYYIGILPTGGGSYTDVKDFPALSVANPIAPNTDAVFDLPIPTSGSGEIVLLRRRNADGTAMDHAADAKNPYTEPTGSTSNTDQLVCVDIVRVGDFTTAASSGITYTRVPTDWQLASTGVDPTLSMTNTGAVPNPIAIDNLPTGVKRASIGATDNKYPFGAFARLGDLMTIPYVGHYAIYATHSATAVLVDATPVTLDVQQVTPMAAPLITGRFMPTAGGSPLSFTTDWRSRVFDFFTVLGNPMSDYFPNMAKESWLYKNGIAPSTPAPAEVKDNDPAVPDYLSPVHGLININTADVDVLNMLPLVTKADGTVDAASNRTAAEAIIAYRRANGPFKSLMDVLNITPTTATVPFPQLAAVPLQGNFFTDASLKTYHNKYQSFVRISNLATVRSDSFVMYILLQQWQDYGSDHPLLVPNTEQRLTVLIDRSQLRSGAGGPIGQILTQTSSSN